MPKPAEMVHDRSKETKPLSMRQQDKRAGNPVQASWDAVSISRNNSEADVSIEHKPPPPTLGEFFSPKLQAVIAQEDKQRLHTYAAQASKLHKSAAGYERSLAMGGWLLLTVLAFVLQVGLLGGFTSRRSEPTTCECQSRVCYPDASCLSSTLDPTAGLGCHAEGQPGCRFETLDCGSGVRGDDLYPSEYMLPCFIDKSCSAGMLGCNATGIDTLRFCGFGPYESVPCPGGTPSSSSSFGVERSTTWVSEAA